MRSRCSAPTAGLPAIRKLIGDGININITLLFSQQVYADVADAYISGLEDFVGKDGDPHCIASVASFFVSRIDTLVDEALDKKIAAAGDAGEKQRLGALKGKIAIANAKLAYQLSKRIYASERWQRLAQRGAQTQRLLWASTGTKNAAYSDVLYVEELIGPATVNTIPPATMDAFRDHGRPRNSLDEDVAGADAAMKRLAGAGISIDAITARRVEDGVRQFADAADQLYASVQKKRRTVLGEQAQRHGSWTSSTGKARCGDEGGARRLAQGKGNGAAAVGRRCVAVDQDRRGPRLGWLGIVDEQIENVAALEAFAADVEAGRVQRRGIARHGRLEPRPRGVRRNFSARNPASPSCMFSTRPTRRRSRRSSRRWT